VAETERHSRPIRGSGNGAVSPQLCLSSLTDFPAPVCTVRASASACNGRFERVVVRAIGKLPLQNNVENRIISAFYCGISLIS
jgi:hypothetical protein